MALASRVCHPKILGSQSERTPTSEIAAINGRAPIYRLDACSKSTSVSSSGFNCKNLRFHAPVRSDSRVEDGNREAVRPVAEASNEGDSSSVKWYGTTTVRPTS